MTRVVIETYLDEFRLGVKDGAVRPSLERAGELNPATRKAYPTPERKPATINHRLSVLASFFDFLIKRDLDAGSGAWRDRPNPVSAGASRLSAHGMSGRDAPRRGRRSEFRMRVPRSLPHDLTVDLANDIIQTAVSLRDKAILTLLYRTGQRIGDWNDGRGHGVLGMRLGDLDPRSATIVVRLKGARDEHRVPVTEDFWALYHRYLDVERAAAGTQAAWIGLRKGRGKPLTYSAFESSLRHIGSKLGANVNAHMFRHTVARAVVETSGLKAAQELLGHAHVTTTADSYARVDHRAMLEAVLNAKGLMTSASEVDCDQDTPSAGVEGGYVFAYDRSTIDELEAATTQTGEDGETTT